MNPTQEQIAQAEKIVYDADMEERVNAVYAQMIAKAIASALSQSAEAATLAERERAARAAERFTPLHRVSLAQIHTGNLIIRIAAAIRTPKGDE
jgi:hypothetical protein